MVTSFRISNLRYVGTGAHPASGRLFYPKSKNRYDGKLQKLYLYTNSSPFFTVVLKKQLYRMVVSTTATSSNFYYVSGVKF